MIELADSVLSYYKKISDYKAASTVALMIVEHIYYKHDTHAVAVVKAHLFNKTWGSYSSLHPASLGKINSNVPIPSSSNKSAVLHPASFVGNPTIDSEKNLEILKNVNMTKKMEDLCKFVFKYGDERMKTRSILCSVYHHALNDRYYQARDLFLISHVQDYIDKADVKTQILYNRALVTVGLCAFRMGMFQKAHDCLSGICGQKMKELLAQGQAKWSDKDPEQERVERRRQIPYHMHINPDLLDCCHLTCAMILELPKLARATVTGSLNQQIISKTFRKYLLLYNKQVFIGPPETTKEHVLAATNAILIGDWRKASDYILGLDVWRYIPNEGGDKIKELLRNRIKEEAVRTYLLINSDYYDSVNINYLCHMFDMEESLARKMISRMIFNKDISAAWDNPSNILIIYKLDPSPIQTLSQTVVEKVSLLMESNERILDPLVGVYGYKDDWTRGGVNTDTRGGPKKFKGGVGFKQSNRPMPAGGMKGPNKGYVKNTRGGNFGTTRTPSLNSDGTKKYSGGQTKKWGSNTGGN